MRINKKSVITQLKGGLGNQMFRYAAGKAIALHHNAELKLDISFLKTNNISIDDFIARPYELSLFPNIHEKLIDIDELYLFRPIIQKIRRKLGYGLYKLPIKKERSFRFDPKLFEKKPSLIIDGDLQSEKYFKKYTSVICSSFEFPMLAPNDHNVDSLSKIHKTNSIAVHVRRGDYLMPYNYAINGICEVTYYERSMTIIKNKYENPVFVFFSNDMNWVKENLLPLTIDYILVEGNSDENSWKDMYLMTQCKHLIIANSSFSWWGAWLNKNESKTVIAPKKWFATENPGYDTIDLIPQNWVLV